MYTSTTYEQGSLARILGLPVTSVRWPTACGGGFGSKLDLSYHPYIALADGNSTDP